jgi:predicted transcriptional regulator
MKQILIAALNKKVDELAKKHIVDKDKVKITYENYQFYYYIERNGQMEKRILEL